MDDDLTPEQKLRKLAMALAAPNVMSAQTAPMMDTAGIIRQTGSGDGIGVGLQQMAKNYQNAIELQKTQPKYTLQNLAKKLFS